MNLQRMCRVCFSSLSGTSTNQGWWMLSMKKLSTTLVPPLHISVAGETEAEPVWELAHVHTVDMMGSIVDLSNPLLGFTVPQMSGAGPTGPSKQVWLPYLKPHPNFNQHHLPFLAKCKRFQQKSFQLNGWLTKTLKVTFTRPNSFFFSFWTGFCATQVRMTLNFCFHLRSPKIATMLHHVWAYALLRVKPKALCMLDKNPANSATTSTPNTYNSMWWLLQLWGRPMNIWNGHLIAEQRLASQCVMGKITFSGDPPPCHSPELQGIKHGHKMTEYDSFIFMRKRRGKKTTEKPSKGGMGEYEDLCEHWIYGREK